MLSVSRGGPAAAALSVSIGKCEQNDIIKERKYHIAFTKFELYSAYVKNV
jgi:hypothetical protein